jgi:hypothetical protein
MNAFSSYKKHFLAHFSNSYLKNLHWSGLARLEETRTRKDWNQLTQLFIGEIMKIVTFLFLAFYCISCTPTTAKFAPNHIGLSPSIEMEIQEGTTTKLKPKIQTNIDWML